MLVHQFHLVLKMVRLSTEKLKLFINASDSKKNENSVDVTECILTYLCRLKQNR